MTRQRQPGPEELSAARLDQIDHTAFFNVLKTAVRIIADTEQILRDSGSGLNAKEWDALAMVVAYGPLRPSELLRTAALTQGPQTLSSLLDRLEQRDLIQRSPHPTKPHGVLVSATDQGSQTAESLYALLARKVVLPFNSQYTDDQLKTIAVLLGELSDR
jgi:DNA-binding MarR family transcriptional regulator